ncbi:MAG: ribbon-helix-helix protein, CopG family [Candidatus Levybacteria bacterium]|nr:ribbon-helix-helix protein, CopG family [Candidatus Levybacteria bacterium]
MTTITISLPTQIAKKVDSETQQHGFATRSEFIRSLIRGYFVKKEFEFEEFNPVPLDKLKLELKQTGKYNGKFINSVIKGLERSSVYEGKTFKS